MSQNFQPGDVLVFQLESGFALLRVLAVDENSSGRIWHVAAYDDFFPDIDTAEASAVEGTNLGVSEAHIALTERAFESTQVAKLVNVPLVDHELVSLNKWRLDPEHQVSDRSVRLMLGLR